MSPLAHARLPYADAETPQQMAADCQAAGANLGMPMPRAAAHLETGHRHSVHAHFQVPASAARLAGSLHLHLN